jgi:polysaccharide biosynthesis/export protein
MYQIIRLCAASLVFAVLAACAGSGPTAGDVRGVNAVGVGSSEYIIGPGDRLNVFVWDNRDISATVPVRPDGRITTPLVEDMVAVGKTPTGLARDIEAVLEAYIRSPQVSVIVENFVGSFGEQIRVVGQAGQPRALSYRDGMTLLDVMIEVGGLTEFAAGNRARVVRTEGNQQREIRVRIGDLLNRGDLSQNIVIRPGDVVVIPESVF